MFFVTVAAAFALLPWLGLPTPLPSEDAKARGAAPPRGKGDSSDRDSGPLGSRAGPTATAPHLPEPEAEVDSEPEVDSEADRASRSEAEAGTGSAPQPDSGSVLEPGEPAPDAPKT